MGGKHGPRRCHVIDGAVKREAVRVRQGITVDFVAMKLLVIAPVPVDAAALRAAMGDEVNGAEVQVVGLAANSSALAFWVSDPDEAIGEAQEAQGKTVESLEQAGIEASGDTGEGEPLVASVEPYTEPVVARRERRRQCDSMTIVDLLTWYPVVGWSKSCNWLSVVLRC